MATHTTACQAIFTDIDGTLLTSDHKVSEQTRQKLQEATSKGILFAPVSARSPFCIEPILKNNNLNGCMIAFNGAMILDEHRHILYENGMDLAKVKELIQFIEQEHFDLAWQVYTATDWIVGSREDPRIQREEAIVGVESTKRPLDTLTEDTSIGKVLCLCNPAITDTAAGILRTRFPQYSIVRSSPIHLEINAAGTNKALAVKRLCQYKGIALKNIIAFGDNYNDLEMLRTAGTGIVMGNAPEDIKEQFPYVTEDNDHDGIAVALEKMRL